MTNEATPEGASQPDFQPDIESRLEAHLFADEPPREAEEPVAQDATPEVEESTEEPVEAADDAPETEAELESAADESEDASDSEAEIPLTPEGLAEALEMEGDEFLSSFEVPVKIDGQESKVTLKDAIKSYQLEGHLTRKSMELSDERKALEKEREDVSKTLQEKTQKLESGLQLAQSLLMADYANVNWNDLKVNDPLEYQQKYIDYQEHMGRLNQASQALAAQKQEYQKQQEVEQQRWLKQQSDELLSKLPAWSDESTKKADAQKIRSYAKKYGFSEDDVNGVTDHRIILMLNDARRYAELQESKPEVTKKVRKAPKLVKSGARKSTATLNSENLKNLRSRVKRSGKAEDAAAFFEQLL